MFELYGGDRAKFDRICEEIRNSGYEFEYGNQRLSRSKLIYQSAVRSIPASKGSAEPIFIICRPCGVYMDYFNGKTGEKNGRWVCPQCGEEVPERAAYAQLDKQKNELYACMEPEDPSDPYADE